MSERKLQKKNCVECTRSSLLRVLFYSKECLFFSGVSHRFLYQTKYDKEADNQSGTDGQTDDCILYKARNKETDETDYRYGNRIR